MSDYLFSRAAKLPTIMAAYPVAAATGEAPVVIAAVNLEWMSQIMGNRGGRPAFRRSDRIARVPFSPPGRKGQPDRPPAG